MKPIIHRTNEQERHKLNILCYGQSGAGKTRLIKTIQKPIMISAEAGILSLKDEAIDYISVNTLKELVDVYEWLVNEQNDYDWVCLDSISEIAEVVLAHEMESVKDGRKAYGEMFMRMSNLIRKFRDLDKHVYMTAKTSNKLDSNGNLLWGPNLPGNKLNDEIPYWFDNVFALRTAENEDGTIRRALQTQSDGSWLAKDRSGMLDPYEPADLGEIINKILSA